MYLQNLNKRNAQRRMKMAKSTIAKRRAVRAAEHKRDVLIEKLGKTKADLQKARLELIQQKKKQG
jgi:hypothetical protein